MNPNLKSHIQYFSGLVIGFALLSAACWVDGAYAAQSKEDKLADKYAQSISDYVTKLADSMKMPMDPQKTMKATLMFMNREFNAGFPSPLVCKELQKYTRKPCAEAYMAFWRVYKKVDEE